MTDLDRLHHAIQACAAKHGITHAQLAEAVIAHRQRLRHDQIEALIKRNHEALTRVMMSSQQFTEAAERIKTLGATLEHIVVISRRAP